MGGTHSPIRQLVQAHYNKPVVQLARGTVYATRVSVCARFVHCICSCPCAYLALSLCFCVVVRCDLPRRIVASTHRTAHLTNHPVRQHSAIVLARPIC